MCSAFGYADERWLRAVRSLQERFSGLTYESPLMDERIEFEPTFDPEPGDGRVEFLYAIHSTTASGAGGAIVLEETGMTLMIGMHWDEEEPAFPSLDHFIECDALMDAARRAPVLEAYAGEGAKARLDELRGRRPGLRAIRAACGPAMQWWADDEVLVQYSPLWDTIPGHPAPTLRVHPATAASL
ncbi:hypothetical protein SAVIM338S_00877 [Streptomyces avidinii]